MALLPLEDDIHSWLPTEFFTDEDIKQHNSNNNCFKPDLLRSSFIDSFVSSVDSPAESQTNSDEEDFLAGLTRRLTTQLSVRKPEWGVVVGSPESTLSGIGGWSMSSNSSPNGVLSPPTTPFRAENDTWDLIHKAAGEVARLKLNTEENDKANSNHGVYERNAFPVKVQSLELPAFRLQNSASTGDFPVMFPPRNQCCNLLLSTMEYQQRVRQEQGLRQQSGSVWGRPQVDAGWSPQLQPQQQQFHHMQTGGRNVWSEGVRSGRPLDLPQSAWPSQRPANQQVPQHHHHLRPQANSCFRAVALGNPVKRKCAGTGVFLPRGYANPPESAKKKSACSTVLLPAKVVQALNLNMDDLNTIGHPQPKFNGAFASEYDAVMARRNAIYAQQQRNSHPENGLSHEIRLPQEWTY